MNTEMSVALLKYMDAIVNDYIAWYENTNTDPEYVAKVVEEFKNDLGFKEGNKYIKVIKGGSVHSFIVNTDSDAKFKRGDILMAASWAAPARNFARGNIFGEYAVRWTGPAI